MNYLNILLASFARNPNIVIRPAVMEDVEPYTAAVKRVWPEEMWVDPEKVRMRIKVNPGGQVVALVNGEFWGMATAIQLSDYDFAKPPNWYEVTADGWCTNHDPSSRIFFGVDLTLLPGSPEGTFDALMAGMAQIVVARRGRYCLLGERLPRYHEFAEHMSAEEYVEAKDERGRYLDPQIGMYQTVPGMKIIKVIPDYIDDPDSLDFGLLLKWTNPWRHLPFPKVWARVQGWLYHLEAAYQDSKRAAV